jgi:hypothetical protein
VAALFAGAAACVPGDEELTALVTKAEAITTLKNVVRRVTFLFFMVGIPLGMRCGQALLDE